MVRGNWQKRVETAQARRKETRQKKLRRDSRAAYKTLVQSQLWDFLDQNIDSILAHLSTVDGVYHTTSSDGVIKNNDEINVHIWTDIAPNFLAINRSHESSDQVDQALIKCDNAYRTTTPINRNSSSTKIDPNAHNTPKSSKSRRHSFDEPKLSHHDHNIKRASNERRSSLDETQIFETAMDHEEELGRRRSSSSCRRNSFDETHLCESPRIYPRENIGFHSVDDHIELPDMDNNLCRKFFFLDTCPHIQKKGSACTCLYEHYPKNSTQKSLAQVLQSQTKSTNYDKPYIIRQTLESSSKASAIALSELDDLVYDQDNDTGDGYIDMLYYMTVPVHALKTGSKGSRDSLAHMNSDIVRDSKVSKALSQVLSQEKCPIGSIVYLTIGNTLIFDRYKGGIVASFPTLEKSTSHVKQSPATRLPDSILEYIIMFLPNNASGILSSVCKTWYNEIGTNSPALWKCLIDRNNWPSLYLNSMVNKLGDATTSSIELRTHYRDLFISHYTIVNRMTNLFAEIKKIDAPQTHPIQRLNQKNCIKTSYSDRSESHSSCVEVLHFSESSILIAYQNCTMRLFDIVSTSSGFGHFLKQSLIVRIAPFGISKKTSTSLRAVTMDNHTILCSYSVYNAKRVNDPSSKCWLASIHREDLLCVNTGSSQDEINEVIHVYNIWQRVIDYLPRIIDHAPDNFADFLISGGLFSSLYINMGNDLVSLGNGRFFFIALILDKPDYDEDSTTLATVSIIFSTAGASILWMEFLPPTLQPELSDNITICSLCGMNKKSSMALAVATSLGSNILLIEVDSRNTVLLREIGDDSRIHRNPELELNAFEVNSNHKRCGLILAEEIILTHKNPHENCCQLSFISCSEKTESNLTALVIFDCVAIRRIQQVGEYVIAEVNFFRMPHDPKGSFGFVIIHIPTRLEVHRYCLEEFDPIDSSSRYRSLFIQKLFAFVAASSAEEEDLEVHVIVSSSSVRNYDKVLEAEVDVLKKKPKKSMQKSTKKDGYARGMTLRG